MELIKDIIIFTLVITVIHYLIFGLLIIFDRTGKTKELMEKGNSHELLISMVPGWVVYVVIYQTIYTIINLIFGRKKE